MSLDFSSITGSVNFLLAGAAYTFELTAITAVLGLALGTLLALARLSTVKWLSYIAKLYIDLMRAVPLVLVLFWFFLLMPEVLKIAFGLDHPVMIGANLTAIINYACRHSIDWPRTVLCRYRPRSYVWPDYALRDSAAGYPEHASSTADADNHSFPGYKPCLCNQRQRLHGRSCQDRPARRPAGFDVLFRSSLLPFSIVVSFDADSSSADEDVRGALNAPNPVRLWPS